mmetsp:Transcript_27821/g.64227  ORF Transcript_27821/g.64227 Transcript_27821/m.64227 type:complete len:283 (+) Transcript_27821:80-928(+)
MSDPDDFLTGAWDALRTVPYISLLAFVIAMVGIILCAIWVGEIDDGLHRIGWESQDVYLALTIVALIITGIVDILVLPFAFLASGKVRETFWWEWGCATTCLSFYRHLDAPETEGSLEVEADHVCKKIAVTTTEIALFVALAVALVANMVNVVFCSVLATIFYLLEEACDIGDGIVVALFRILERMGLVDGTVQGWLQMCDEELHFFNAAVIVGVGAVILSLTQVVLLICLIRNGTLLRLEPRLAATRSRIMEGDDPFQIEGLYDNDVQLGSEATDDLSREG